MTSEKEIYKVLILEDNANDQELIKFELLESVQAELIIKWVANKQQFVDALHEFNPDIVLSDYQLPGFNGFEALEMTIVHDKNIPFIIITGSLTEEVAAESIKRGAWDYVVKERLNRLPSAFENVLKLRNERLKSQRAHAELKIRKDKESLQLKLLWDAIASAPNSVEITDRNGTILYVNSLLEKTTGYSSMELIGKTPSIFKSGNHNEAFYRNLWDTILSGQVWKGEISNKKKDGDLFWEEVSISPITDHDGEIQYFVAIKNDITDRKIAEEVARESKQAFQTLAQVSPVGIFRTDSNGFTTYVNPKWMELSGLTFAEAMGNGWTKAVHPNDHLEMFENWKKYRKPNAEYRFLKADGTVVWVIGNVVPELNNDKVVGYIGTITDITYRKIAEKELQESKIKYQNLVENINDALYEIDSDLTIKYISPVITKMTGFPVEHYQGKHLAEIIFKDDVQMVIDRAKDLFSENIKLIPEYRIPTMDGETIWLRSSSKPIVENEKVVGIRGIAIDITQQKKTEQELIIAKEKAEASDRLKTDFMNNISHEIRTPLNGLLGFAPMVADPEISVPEKLRFLEIMNQSGDRLLQTITNYMDISMITSGNLMVRMKEFNLIQQMKEIIQKYEPVCAKTNIQLLTEISPDVQNTLLNSDRNLLDKIINHLLDNAFKYTSQGSVIIGLKKEESNLLFSVKDTGCGISCDNLSFIFDRFFRNEDSATRTNEGSGLGLSIVKELVQILGGSISVESKKNQGSTFTFTIPLGRPN